MRVLERQFDAAEGGFGGAPKFPPAMRLELLLRHWLRTGDASARAMTEKTLAKMAAGGMYDQVGGGFHRYSVDARWLVPHFEKMLYDNAMLARVYVLAFRAFGNPDDARVARETLDYLLREMTPEEGGFFAAQDADSGGEEGTFYVWNPDSLADAVGADAAPVVAARFGVTARGNFEDGETVLSVVRGLPELAADFGRTEEEIARAARGGAPEDVRRPLAPRRPGHRRQAADGLDRAGDLGLRPRGARARGAALRGRRAPRRRPDPRPLRPRRPAPPPREGRQGRHSGLRDGLRVPDRGAPRPLRSDLRAALLHRGRPPPGRSSTRTSRIRAAATSCRPPSTTA